jgi:hypothetical protein
MADYESEYSQPDGYCESCGVDLAADPDGDHDEHHRTRWRCWREDNGPTAERQTWQRPNPEALEWQHQDRQRAVTVDLTAAIRALERRVSELERAQHGRRPAA